MLQQPTLPTDLADAPPGPELCATLAGLELSRVPNGALVEVLRAWSRLRAHVDARFVAAVAEVGRRDPSAGWDEAAWLAEPGRYAADETRAALAWTRRAAEAEHEFAEVLTTQLPMVFAAFDNGEIDRPKARVFCEHLAGLPVVHIETICRALLPVAGSLTTGQLRVRLARMVVGVAPDRARDQYERAVRERAVVGYLNADGTAVVAGAGLPVEEAAAACDRLDRLARAVKRAGRPGRLDQIRADLFVGLLDGRLHHLTRGEIVEALLAAAGAGRTPPRNGASYDDEGLGDGSSRAPEAAGIEVRVELSTLLGLDNHPGEVPGWGPIPAHVARRVVARQRAGEWRFAVTDRDGYLLCGGITRRRPKHTRDVRPGGSVELQVPAALLAQGMRSRGRRDRRSRTSNLGCPP